MKNQIRHALLGGVAAVSLAVAAGGAQAQVQMPGWFGSVTGWYYFDGGNDGLRIWNVPAFETAGPDNGWGGRVYAGYRFSNPWDIAAGVQGTWLTKGKSTFNAEGTFKNTQKADYMLGDLEVGYNGASGTVGYRFFVGVRYAEFDHRTVSNCINCDGFAVTYANDYWGVGPRIGANFSARFAPDSNFSVFGDVSGSVLFGKLKGKFHETDDDPVIHAKGSRTVWNVDGQLGIAYEIAPNVNIGAGIRAEFWNKPADGGADDTWNGFPPTLARSGSSDRFMWGPFARVSYNIGAPRAVPMPMAPPAPVAQSTNAFIIFFDWDRSVLTPQARDTVKQAADQFKAKGNARVTLTGHADRSGADAYNMALSLRRGAAAKDELVRNGVPANAIVIIGKGESQPLVPTADGVREPQNRRVEIVLQ